MSAIPDPDMPPSVASSNVHFGFDNTFSCLPERFYGRIHPTRVASPRLVRVNAALARLLQLDQVGLESEQGVEILAGNRIADGSEPLAMAYAGHQFGHFVPQLGDGRANLLGEVVGSDGVRYDVQLKGSGRTPFSRGGDGRAALGPVLREYILSEAMAALGVPTTRALAVVTTGEKVFREYALPGAVLTRVATSHLRVGTFQYFAVRNDVEAIRMLAEYAMVRHSPTPIDVPRRYRTFLDGVITRQANLIARWMLLGFVHGVMNTDNTSISGETIDYGPCAFMESYDPEMVFSSIDSQGRYAYSNQPVAAQWNLTRLAESLLPLLELEEGSKEAGLVSAKEALAGFKPQFDAAYRTGLSRKLGLTTEYAGDAALGQDLLERMAAQRADFTLTFRRLCDAAEGAAVGGGARALFADPAVFDAWEAQWRLRLVREEVSVGARAAAMRQENPAFIPRNHRVEAAIVAAVEQQDFTLFEELLDVISRPYETRPELAGYATPARSDERVLQTFCGT